MDAVEIERRISKTEERSKSNTHRLDKVGSVTEEIHTLSRTMVELVQEIKHTNETVISLDEKVDRMENRVDEMEKAPAKEFSNFKKTVVDKVSGAVIGFLAAGLIWAAVQAF